MANRDEFISFVNKLISLSKSITDDQYKSLLQQAVQEYDLTFDDASEILTTYGLVVGESVNYFEVLGLSIEELTHHDEVEIASHIEIAHKRHYTESLQAGGLPRSDGRTQEQWRTLLNDAFYTLIDTQKRTEYIDSLTKNRSQDEGQVNIGDDPKSEEQVITTQKSTSISFSVPENMKHITSGEFQMGNQNENANDREIPVHSVFVDEFYMDKYPVTNAQYTRFIDANPVWSKPASSLVWHRKNKRKITGRMNRQDYLKNWSGNTFPQGMEEHPVTYINWYAAMAYAKWIGKRLPTEAEWEKAARGGITGQKYPWGNTLNADSANCNNTMVKPPLLENILRITTVCMIWLEMSGNGVWMNIRLITILNHRMKIQLQDMTLKRNCMLYILIMGVLILNVCYAGVLYFIHLNPLIST